MRASPSLESARGDIDTHFDSLQCGHYGRPQAQRRHTLTSTLLISASVTSASVIPTPRAHQVSPPVFWSQWLCFPEIDNTELNGDNILPHTQHWPWPSPSPDLVIFYINQTTVCCPRDKGVILSSTPRLVVCYQLGSLVCAEADSIKLSYSHCKLLMLYSVFNPTSQEQQSRIAQLGEMVG